jgi:hypothetical protein
MSNFRLATHVLSLLSWARPPLPRSPPRNTTMHAPGRISMKLSPRRLTLTQSSLARPSPFRWTGPFMRSLSICREWKSRARTCTTLCMSPPSTTAFTRSMPTERFPTVVEGSLRTSRCRRHTGACARRGLSVHHSGGGRYLHTRDRPENRHAVRACADQGTQGHFQRG